MKNRIEKHFNESYAYGKLAEFVQIIFVDLAPAREKLSENLHFFAAISPSDFKNEKHQQLWKVMQTRLRGKTKNIGLKRAPIDRLTVQNKTPKFVLESLWSIYEECNE